MPADRELYIAGAGGAGREAMDIALASGRRVTAFLDENQAGRVVRGHRVLLPRQAGPGADYVVAVAAAPVRLRLASLLDACGLRPARLVHPRAVICGDTVLGCGSIVHANVLVSCGVSTGAHVQVHYNATIGHDCVLADLVTVLPGANVAGNVHLGAGALVGSGAVVLQGLTVGAGASVGAGAVVTRDVPAETVVVGSPARPLPAPA